jgi:hypothetical protein
MAGDKIACPTGVQFCYGGLGTVAVIVVGRLVHVVVIRDNACHHHHREQKRRVNDNSARDCSVCLEQVRGNRAYQPGGGNGQAEFPGPEHQIQMILTTHLAPERQPYLDRDQEFDYKQRA